MHHEEYMVDLLNATGQIIGRKPRKSIDKNIDAFHSVYIFLITPLGEVIVTVIPEHPTLPNLYTGRLGVPVATIRRTSEDAWQAAKRALKREMNLGDSALIHLGEVTAGRRFMSCFYLISELPKSYNKQDVGKLQALSPKELRRRILSPSIRTSPSLEVLWKTFRRKLPI